MTEYIEPEDVDELVEDEGFHYRDRNGLLSALASPMPVFGEEVYPGIHQKAAVLFTAINHNHPLLDGNKRLSCGSTRTPVPWTDQHLADLWLVDDHRGRDAALASVSDSDSDSVSVSDDIRAASREHALEHLQLTYASTVLARRFTPGMTTTIKVSDDLRDRLKEQAARDGLTLGAHLARLADAEVRMAEPHSRGGADRAGQTVVGDD